VTGDFISGNQTGVYVGAGATSNDIDSNGIGTGTNGVTNVGNLGDGVILDGVAGNELASDLFVYNGDVGILGENGSNLANNTFASDTFLITVSGVTYGNKNGGLNFI
jgi:hypothetical protein